MIDRVKFLAVMNTLAATFGRVLEPLAIEGYWLALSGLEDAQIGDAFTSSRLLREDGRVELAPPPDVISYPKVFKVVVKHWSVADGEPSVVPST